MSGPPCPKCDTVLPYPKQSEQVDLKKWECARCGHVYYTKERSY